MKLDIIKVGNSKGIRIPKAVLEACDIGDAVDLQIQDDKLVLIPLKDPRAGWEEAFKADPPNSGHQEVFGESIANEFDKNEWEW